MFYIYLISRDPFIKSLPLPCVLSPCKYLSCQMGRVLLSPSASKVSSNCLVHPVAMYETMLEITVCGGGSRYSRHFNKWVYWNCKI